MNNNQNDFLLSIKNFYKKFNSLFNLNISSKCGDCYRCCSSSVKFPSLFPLENDYIEKYIEDNSIPVTTYELKMFHINKNLPVCPFYLQGTGCRIYEARPLFCRMYGLFEYETSMPDNCIYKGLGLNYEEVKKGFLLEYNLLNLEYTKYKLSKSSQEDQLDLLIELGNEYLLLHRYDEADYIFREVIEIDPENYASYHNLGLVSIWKKHFSEAIDYLKTALELGGNKKYPSLYEDIGYSYLCMSKPKEAEEFLIKSIDQNPNRAGSHIGMLFVYQQTGQKLKAKRKLNQLLRAFPEDKQVKALKESSQINK